MEEALILENRHGESVWLGAYGASIMRVQSRDRSGNLGDVVLGFDDPARYRDGHPHFGSTAGRVANRIANARFTLDGVVVALDRNDGAHHLHGGRGGFAFKRWEVERLPGAVRFAVESPDGDSGYPGVLHLETTYHFDDSASLRIDFEARAEQLTVVAPTSHAYWNLRDGGRGSVLDHELRLYAERMTPADDDGIPTGELQPVAGTPFDFSVATPLGRSIDRVDQRGGYDHNFVVDGSPGQLRPAARLSDPTSGRVLTVSTTFPGLQLYTGNGLDGSIEGREGVRYGRRSGVCLEAQFFPDSPNQPGFPSVRLEPGTVARQTTIYSLSAS